VTLKKLVAWSILILFGLTILAAFVAACVADPLLLTVPGFIIIAVVLFWAIVTVAGPLP